MPFPDNHPDTHLSPLSPPAPELTGRQSAPRPSKHRDPAPSYGDLEAPEPGAFCAARPGVAQGHALPRAASRAKARSASRLRLCFPFKASHPGNPLSLIRRSRRVMSTRGGRSSADPGPRLARPPPQSLSLACKRRRPRATEAEKPREQVPPETSSRPGRTGCRSCRALEPSVKNLLRGLGI